MTIELHHATSYEVGATTSPAFSKFVAALLGAGIESVDVSKIGTYL
jgi:hypothetical protein